ncbi:MAG: 3-oxoacyl-ACP synthase III [Shewanella sp.]|nr:3-oxoacyl-ACP synthase III [Shewanella sp.]MCF1430462.1 3-oxoacyl-ACP synthase III [Shewanella sp.]MCF1437990.1 3-oxoacyl-ACP synthase III [Shewanella sp.]MCF1456199.1 3-oxoacyl-ACP synthase III [Shewanella sp.]
MNYSRVFVSGLGYELAPDVISSTQLEQRLLPLYQKFRIPHGQLAALTGIKERRWWPAGFKVADGAVSAARKALATSGIALNDIGALIYTGVCREQHEPATACRVASQLGTSSQTVIYDISNACLGVLSGMLDVANRIELGQIRAGMVVACESAREIVEASIKRLLQAPSMQGFAGSLATLTGGSGAVAVVLSDAQLAPADAHRLRGATVLSAPKHHDLCHWGMSLAGEGLYRDEMRTDAVSLLKHGVVLAQDTWQQFLHQQGWHVGKVDKVICHQVGQANRRQVLTALDIAPEREYPTFASLGNMGSVSLPASAAIAAEQGFLLPGDRVGWLGIGSGLNCMMLALEW